MGTRVGGARFRVTEASDDWAVGASGRVLVTVWRSKVTASRVASVDRTIAEIVRGSGGRGYAAISVIEPGITLTMEDDARKVSTDMQTRWASHLEASAYLVEGTSFAVAAVRTLTAGMQLLTRTKYPVKVFAAPRPLAEWVGPFVELAPADVERVLAEARAARS